MHHPTESTASWSLTTDSTKDDRRTMIGVLPDATAPTWKALSAGAEVSYSSTTDKVSDATALTRKALSAGAEASYSSTTDTVSDATAPTWKALSAGAEASYSSTTGTVSDATAPTWKALSAEAEASYSSTTDTVSDATVPTWKALSAEAEASYLPNAHKIATSVSDRETSSTDVGTPVSDVGACSRDTDTLACDREQFSTGRVLVGEREPRFAVVGTQAADREAHLTQMTLGVREACSPQMAIGEREACSPQISVGKKEACLLEMAADEREARLTQMAVGKREARLSRAKGDRALASLPVSGAGSDRSIEPNVVNEGARNTDETAELTAHNAYDSPRALSCDPRERRNEYERAQAVNDAMEGRRICSDLRPHRNVVAAVVAAAKRVEATRRRSLNVPLLDMVDYVEGPRDTRPRTLIEDMCTDSLSSRYEKPLPILNITRRLEARRNRTLLNKDGACARRQSPRMESSPRESLAEEWALLDPSTPSSMGHRSPPKKRVGRPRKELKEVKKRSAKTCIIRPRAHGVVSTTRRPARGITWVKDAISDKGTNTRGLFLREADNTDRSKSQHVPQAKAKAKAKARGVVVKRQKRVKKTFNIVRQMEVNIIPFMAKAFFAFLRNRERIRLNLEAGITGNDAYEGVEGVGVFTKSMTVYKLKTRRFTNVYRRNDRTSRDFTLLLAQYVDEYREAHPDVSEHQVLTYVVFTLGVWRAFGTSLFAKEVGFITKWDNEQKEAIRDLMKKYMDYGNVSKLCTAAYKPANLIRASLAREPPNWKDFDVTVNARLDDLWLCVADVPKIACETASWEQVAKVISRARYYGEGVSKHRSPSFHAKELVQDLLDTRLFGGRDNVLDLNTWCAVGPGAKRGLNWVTGRIKPVSDISNLSQKQAVFEMKTLFSLCVDRFYYHWNGVETRVGGKPPPPLELHDIQFGLCEFDKFMRAQNTNPYVRGDASRNNVRFFKYDAEKCATSWLYDVSDFAEDALKRKEERQKLLEAEKDQQLKYRENLLLKRESLKNEYIREGRAVPEARVVPFFNAAEATAASFTVRSPKAKRTAKIKARATAHSTTKEPHVATLRAAKLGDARSSPSSRARRSRMTVDQCVSDWKREMAFASTPAASSTSSATAGSPAEVDIKEEKGARHEDAHPRYAEAQNAVAPSVVCEGDSESAAMLEEVLHTGAREETPEMKEIQEDGLPTNNWPSDDGSPKMEREHEGSGCDDTVWKSGNDWGGEDWKMGNGWRGRDDDHWNAGWKAGNWRGRKDGRWTQWKHEDSKRARYNIPPGITHVPLAPPRLSETLGPPRRVWPNGPPTPKLRWLERAWYANLRQEEEAHSGHWVPGKDDTALASVWQGTIPPRVIRLGPYQLLIRGMIFHRRANTVYTFRPDLQARGRPTWWSIDNQFVLGYSRKDESVMTLIMAKDVSVVLQLQNARSFELMYWDDQTGKFVEKFSPDRGFTGCHVSNISGRENQDLAGNYVFAPELYQPTNKTDLLAAPWWHLNQKSFLYFQRKGMFAIAKKEHYQMVRDGLDLGLIAQNDSDGVLRWMECVKDPYNRDTWIQSSVACQFVNGKESPYAEAMEDGCAVHPDAWTFIEQFRLQLIKLRTEQLNRRRLARSHSAQPSGSQPSRPQDAGRQRSGHQLSTRRPRPLRPPMNPQDFE